MIELSPRLLALAEQVPKGDRVADIGTDHAHLPIYLLQTGHIPFAIASDIHPEPLERGRAEAARHGIAETQLCFRCSDGLQSLESEEVDSILIAGMGGEMIAHCLSAVPWSTDPRYTYLLQAMSKIPDLRRYLDETGFAIEAETLVAEGEKLYLLLRVRFGRTERLHEAEIWVGRQWQGMDAPLRGRYLAENIQRLTRSLQGLRQAKQPNFTQIAQMETLLHGVEAMQEAWTKWQV